MSSPSKKLKRTPKKPAHNREFTDTQVSKVTSTPQRRSKNVVSPDISTIPSNGGSVRTRLSDIFFEEESLSEASSCNVESIASAIDKTSTSLSVAESEECGVLALENYDKYLDDFHRIRYTGRIWNLYRPLHENALYAQILQNPQNVQDVVTEFVHEYDRQPKHAMHALIKLCVDVCGYQNFEVADRYDFKKETSKRIIEMMESDRVLIEQEVLINKAKYLLMEPATRLSEILKVSIYNFLQKLILCAHEASILYDDFFSTHFFGFVKGMAFSKICAVRHTGVVFGIKILTAVVMVYEKIINKNRSHQQKADINAFLEFFYIIFVRNCNLQSNGTVLMRVECVYELSIWVRYFPNVFITQLQAANYLLKHVKDSSKYVRFAALETCKAFVETPCILALLKDHVEHFPEIIGGRFYDVDIEVAVKAIDIYTSLLRRDNSLISTRRFDMLMDLVCDKHFPIGEAASQFLISFCEKSKNSQETTLLQLVKFSMKPSYAIKQLLVEGCLDRCPTIRNWELYIKILTCDDVELDIKKHLVELFAEAVHQVLMGRSTILREKSRIVKNVDSTKRENIAKYFPELNTFLKKYKDHPHVLLELLKIFNTVEVQVLSDMSPEVIVDICSSLEYLFCYHNDETLLKKLGETWRNFFNTAHGDRVLPIIEDISSKYADNLAVSLANQNKEIADTSLKVSILFADFDLSKKLKWETLFDTWGEVDEAGYEFLFGIVHLTTICNEKLLAKYETRFPLLQLVRLIIKYCKSTKFFNVLVFPVLRIELSLKKIIYNLLPCCKWYLIWSLKNLPSIANHASQFPTLLRLCGEFTGTCFNTLQRLKGQPLHFKTYECLCDFYIKYTKNLEGLTKSSKPMEQLKLVIEDKQLHNVFISFLEKYVIHNTTMPLFERRHHVVKFIDLVHSGVLSVKCLGHIFRYYHTYNKEYGPMIESSLSDMANVDENAFLMVVVYTLIVCYEDILKKHNAIDMMTQEAKSLKLVIKQFLNLKEFKMPDKKLIKAVYFSINYSVKDQENYAFLYFIKYFAELVKLDTDRTEVLEFLKKKVPKAAEKNDAVLSLANCLKNPKPGTSKISKTSKFHKRNQENTKQKKKSVTKRRSLPKTPGKKSDTTKTKGVQEKERNVDSETEVSDDLTIHDSESNDLEESLMNLNV